MYATRKMPQRDLKDTPGVVEDCSTLPDLTAEQSVQEGRYDYPYHYIPSWDGHTFSQTQTWPWGYEYLSYIGVILEKAVATSFDSLLDVGCGDGRFLFELSRRAPGKRLAGIDFSERAIAYAKIMAPGIEWVCGDIAKPGVVASPFDVVTLIETLEQVPRCFMWVTRNPACPPRCRPS